MSSLGRVLQVGEPLAQPSDGLHGLVDRQRRLRDPDEPVGVANLERGHGIGRVDDLDVVGRLAERALDLLVALVADQQDVVVLGREPHGLLVHLRDQRAGGVDRLQRPRRGRGVHGRARRRARRTRRARPRAPRRSRPRRSRPARRASRRRACCGRSPCARTRARRSARAPSRRRRPRGRRRRSTREERPGARACRWRTWRWSPGESSSGARRTSRSLPSGRRIGT